MKEFTVGSSQDQVISLFPERVIKRVALGEKILGVMRVGMEFYAFENSCPHRGASLLQANINGQGEIICPLHQYRFDLKTGQVKAGYCRDLEVFPAILTEDGLKITVPDS